MMDEDRCDTVRALSLSRAEAHVGISAVTENIVRKIDSHYVADITVIVPDDGTGA